MTSVPTANFLIISVVSAQKKKNSDIRSYSLCACPGGQWPGYTNLLARLPELSTALQRHDVVLSNTAKRLGPINDQNMSIITA